MGEIEKALEEIIQEQLKQCKENKKVPSSDELSTIQTLKNLKSF